MIKNIQGAKIKLKVHSWGGLGSQLYAVALVFELQRLYSKKKIILTHRTSGVTRRDFELYSILPSCIEFKQIDDYVPISKFPNFHSRIYGRKIKFFLKKVLGKFLISLDFDNNKNFTSIRFWTLEIRGHYSKLPISNDYIDFLIDMLEIKNMQQNKLANTLAVHYRLGDLTYLSEKSYIESKKVIMAINEVRQSFSFNKILIFSDSIEVAKEKLSDLSKLPIISEYSCAPTLTVIKESLASKYFIGTNSKVSFWIQSIRQYLGKKSLIIDGINA